MTNKQRQQIADELFRHFEKEYGASREDFDQAVIRSGLIRSRINTFFLVQANEKKNKHGNSLSGNSPKI